MERRTDPKKSAALDAAVRRLVPADRPGLAVAVIRDRAVVHLAGYGRASLKSAAPITPQTRFHMASCGKQFTGLGIMLLKEAGKLRFDDSLGRHIPELAGFGAKVTIRALLHHLAGVRDFYDAAGERKLLALSRHPVNEDVIRLYAALGCPMTRQAGRFSYSNSGYDLLGCVIERVSGETYREFFRSQVFAPLGMADTFSLPARLPRHRTATGYEKRKHRLQPQSGSPLDGICGSGSFYSTVADLCRYEMALAASRLVAPATMRVALTSGVNRRGRPTGYGFGWGLGTLRGERVAEHSGGWTGFVSHQRRFLDRPLSIYVLSNNDRLEPSRITDAATGIFW